MITAKRRAELHLPDGFDGLPAAPPAELDAVLDAAVRCFVRYGVKRTSVTDIAAELGVNRATVYRQAGNVDSILVSLSARELTRMLDEIPLLLSERDGPEGVVAVLVWAVELIRTHPVLHKVMQDEPELLGPFVLQHTERAIEAATAAFVPLLSAAMDAGTLARRDPEVLAGWLTRIALALILAPPTDLSAFAAELLVPALTPEVTAP